MDASTRPSQKNHRSACITAAALVVVLLSATQFSFASTTDHALLPQPDIIQNSEPAAHDISIATVKAGSEGLELTAKFTEKSQETVSDVAWTINNESGEKVFEGITALADATLPPGDYRVTARYGSAQILQGVTVHEGTKLAVNFILNAGGLRVLPRIKNLTAQNSPSISKIFALSGPLRGQLITTSSTPGEVLKMRAGEYRIESHFENGNTEAVVDVKVKPGILSAVNIDHVAGLATLSLANVSDVSVEWTIKNDTVSLTAGNAPSLSLVLKPGHYTATAAIAGQKYSQSFDIAVGQISDVNIQNQ